MLHIHSHDYLMTFKGYMHYNQELKDQCIENLLHAYIDELGHHRFTAEELREEVIAMVKADLDYYKPNEEYELCTILRDLRNVLQI